jgi:hypothetical protein
MTSSLISKYLMICIILTVIVACTFLVELEVQENIPSYYVRNKDMEDA